MTTDPFENAELAAAERAVARRPAQRTTPLRQPATRAGRVATVAAPVVAAAAVAAQTTFSFAPTSVPSVWFALVVLVAATVLTCVAAGELGGRRGRVSGVVSGVVIVPPVAVTLGWWVAELLGLLS